MKPHRSGQESGFRSGLLITPDETNPPRPRASPSVHVLRVTGSTEDRAPTTRRRMPRDLRPSSFAHLDSAGTFDYASAAVDGGPPDMPELHLLSPKGFRAGAAFAGIRTARRSPDVGLLVCDAVAPAAAVFTANEVIAAPVKVGREHVAHGRLRAVVVNAGNANACTGLHGELDARHMCATT